MRTIFAFILALFSLSTVSGQSFEGKIVYEVKYKSKLHTVTDQQFNSIMGTAQTYFIKGGNYKSVTNGELLQWQLYSNTENKLYTKLSNSEIINWNDAAENPDSVISVTLKKGVTKVLGYTCDEVILTCKTGIQKYYFSTKLPVDVALFKQHKFGNWYEYLQASKSLPLKTIIDTPNFIVETVATEVKPIKLAESEFYLPKDAEIADGQ